MSQCTWEGGTKTPDTREVVMMPSQCNESSQLVSLLAVVVSFLIKVLFNIGVAIDSTLGTIGLNFGSSIGGDDLE